MDDTEALTVLEQRRSILEAKLKDDWCGCAVHNDRRWDNGDLVSESGDQDPTELPEMPYGKDQDRNPRVC